MNMQEERQLFYIIAEPITNYFKEQGLDPMQTMGMTTTIAQRIFDNIKNRIEVVRKEEDETTDKN